MLTRHLILCCTLASLSLIGVASAQDATQQTGTGSATTGTGALLDPRDTEGADTQKARARRVKGFRIAYLQSKKPERQFRDRVAVLEEKRRALYRSCRAEIRAANRDTKFSTLLRCFQSDIAIELEHMGRYEELFGTLPGVSKTVHDSVMQGTTALRDALSAIAFAANSGVYGSQEELIEARDNLHELYRRPFRDALVLLRTDRTLAWTSYMITLIDEARDAEQAATGTMRPEWKDIRICFSTNETALDALIKAEPNERRDRLPVMLEDGRRCGTLLRGMWQTGSGSGSAQL